MGNRLITWRSKKQLTIALSSMEAEYMALAQATQEAIWLQTLMIELEIGPKGPITIHSNNQAMLAHARNEMITQRTKHIDIKYHFIRDAINKGEIVADYIGTNENLADLFTTVSENLVIFSLRREINSENSENSKNQNRVLVDKIRSFRLFFSFFQLSYGHRNSSMSRKHGKNALKRDVSLSMDADSTGDFDSGGDNETSAASSNEDSCISEPEVDTESFDPELKKVLGE